MLLQPADMVQPVTETPFRNDYDIQGHPSLSGTAEAVSFFSLDFLTEKSGMSGTESDNDEAPVISLNHG